MHMRIYSVSNPISFFVVVVFLFLSSASCNDESKSVGSTEIVESPEEINARAEAVIKGTLKEILRNDKKLPDSFKIKNAAILQYLYEQNSFTPLWSSKGNFTPAADSLFSFINRSMEWGLFPEHYYFEKLALLKLELSDTSGNKKLNASTWAYNDLLYSSAFVQLVKDIKIGRLLPDSVVERDSTLTLGFFSSMLNVYKQVQNASFISIEPQHSDYKKLKAGIRPFLDSADFTSYTFVSGKDSNVLRQLIYKRLAEEDSSLAPAGKADSIQLADAIKNYQKRKGLKADGKIFSALIARLNNTDKEKFIRIAINMDRFKQLQALPEQYIWVNIPSYYLQLRQGDTVALKSRVVVGKPVTKTPIITSAISDMMTYPKWTIPESIIKKEILPELKKDPGYTIRKGYSLIDRDGNEVDPYTVDWKKFKENIPYKVVQGSGDDNALGVLKFNFPNKFSVYLHDTNQRQFFSRSSRALSHGCVRVQDWKDLAVFILKNDSLNSTQAVKVDSLERWLAQKQKRYVPVRKRVPLFIRYFTNDVNEKGKIVFYEDIYGEDSRLRDKIYPNKIL